MAESKEERYGRVGLRWTGSWRDDDLPIESEYHHEEKKVRQASDGQRKRCHQPYHTHSCSQSPLGT